MNRYLPTIESWDPNETYSGRQEKELEEFAPLVAAGIGAVGDILGGLLGGGSSQAPVDNTSVDAVLARQAEEERAIAAAAQAKLRSEARNKTALIVVAIVIAVAVIGGGAYLLTK